jgi:Icc-related predicted phosphoesterase
MKIIALTDIHSRKIDCNALVMDLKQADLILIAGDITHFGKGEDVISALDDIRQHNSRILAVHGNCDYPDVLTEFQKQKLSLHGTIMTENGIQFLGLGGSLPCPGCTPSEYSDFIFVSHQPPYNTLNDKIANGSHVGSRSVRSFIEKYQPVACITGHIHEGIGIDQIGRTKIVNPGPFNSGNYLYLELKERDLHIDIRKCF